MSTLAKEIDEWIAITSADKDDRPEIRYRPMSEIKVGHKAVIMNLDINFGGSGATGVVLAYDKATGAFETMKARYVLDKSFKH